MKKKDKNCEICKILILACNFLYTFSLLFIYLNFFYNKKLLS